MPTTTPGKMAWLLSALTIVVSSCGGGEGSDEEEYFQELEAILIDLDERGDRLPDSDEVFQDADPENVPQLLADSLDEVIQFLEGAAQEIERLEPPTDIEDAHEAYVAAIRSGIAPFRDLADAARESSPAELADLDPSTLDDASSAVDDACAALQQAADERDIQVDLQCEGESPADRGEQAEQDDSPDIPGEFHESAGRQHVNEDVDYPTNPPTSGPHNPVPLPAGVYRDPQLALVERAVHSMEHGSVIIWYNCEAGGLDRDECNALIDGLRDRYENLLMGEAGGGLLIINNPDQDAFIALTSWTRLLELDEFDEERIDEFLDANRCRFDPQGFCD